MECENKSLMPTLKLALDMLNHTFKEKDYS